MLRFHSRDSKMRSSEQLMSRGVTSAALVIKVLLGTQDRIPSALLDSHKQAARSETICISDLDLVPHVIPDLSMYLLAPTHCHQWGMGKREQELLTPQLHRRTRQWTPQIELSNMSLCRVCLSGCLPSWFRLPPLSLLLLNLRRKESHCGMTLVDNRPTTKRRQNRT